MSVRAIQDSRIQVAEEQCSCKETPFYSSPSRICQELYTNLHT